MAFVLVALLACQVLFSSGSKRTALVERRLTGDFMAIVMVAWQVDMQNPWSEREAHRLLG